MKAENPYSASSVIGEEGSFQCGYKVSFGRILVAWISFCLITLIATLAIALTIGVVVIVILVAVDADRTTALAIRPIYAYSCGMLVPIPVSLLCYWWTVQRIIVNNLDPPKQ